MIVNNKEIIKKIKNKQLPLEKDELSYIRKKCLENDNFVELDGIHYVLRRDWLNNDLDPIKKATTNISIESHIWREELEFSCYKSIRCFIGINMNLSVFDIGALLIWRGSLAYIKSLSVFNIKPFHTQMSRDERTLKIDINLNLSDGDKIEIKKKQQFIIPDPMLATGNSCSEALEMLKKIDYPMSKITVISVVSCPEGVFRLLEEYPEVKIITASFDRCLNESAYILDGLGDCGDKYFFENDISNFRLYRNLFNKKQWEHLEMLLK